MYTSYTDSSDPAQVTNIISEQIFFHAYIYMPSIVRLW